MKTCHSHICVTRLYPPVMFYVSKSAAPLCARVCEHVHVHVSMLETC